MVYLHNHTDASQAALTDCILKVSTLVDRVVNIGGQGCAITDHEACCNYVKFLHYIKRGKESGKIPKNFKGILGDEIYLINGSAEKAKESYPQEKTKYFHFILLAKNELGCYQIRKISSQAWMNSYYTGKLRRRPTEKSFLEKVIKDNPGNIIATSACLGSEIDQLCLEYYYEENASNKKLIQDKINNFLYWCLDLFGDDFYLEMQPSLNEDQIVVNKMLYSLSKDYNIKMIITTDSHMATENDRSVHKAYLNSKEDEDREVDEFYATAYVMEENKIRDYFDYLPKKVIEASINNTLKIGEQIEDYSLDSSTIVPKSDLPQFELKHIFYKDYEKYHYLKNYAYSEHPHDRYMLKLIEDGFLEKIPLSNLTAERKDAIIKRIDIELGELWEISKKMNDQMSAYYILTRELINIMWNKSESLIGVSRGSAGGFEICYLMGITQLDSMAWQLPHWRHITATRPDYPDIDLDSEQAKRNIIIDDIKEYYGAQRVINCCTFKTIASKSAVLIAARGMYIDNDTSAYLASYIPWERGSNWSLHDVVYGNEELKRKPVNDFIKEIEHYPGLLETAMGLEGLIDGISSHASAVYLYQGDFLDHNAAMLTPNGTVVTQFNMDDSNALSGLKEDMLTVTALDKIHICMNLLIKAGHMEWKGSIRETYDYYLLPEKLEYNDPRMWDLVGENAIPDLFQFDSDMGITAITSTKPRNIIQMSQANNLMRLMGEDGKESPLARYVRYKANINLWYDCMEKDYHLNTEEIKIMEEHLKDLYGVADSQESMMQLAMDSRITGFSMLEANYLRKAIAKKKHDLLEESEKLFYSKGDACGTSKNLLNYVWIVQIGALRGYGFSTLHSTGYSLIALQEMNLYCKYNPVFWNCACLTVNAGADDTNEDNGSTQYGKIATAVSNMQKRDIQIALPLINTAEFAFIPDEKNNRIIYSLKAINGIGDEVVRLIIQNRPYASMQDFCDRMITTKLIKTAQMIKLIKAGCFTELDNTDRRKTLNSFLEVYVLNSAQQLNFQNFGQLNTYDAKYKIVPDDIKLAMRHRHFRDYVLDDYFFYRNFIDPKAKRGVPKCGYNDRYFCLNEVSMPFYQSYYSEDSIVGIKGEFYIISEKKFKKENDKNTFTLKEWLGAEETLKLFNKCKMQDLLEKYGSGTVAKWEMEALSFYNEPHELVNANESIYGIVNYFELPEQPEVYDYYVRTVKQKINGVEVKEQKRFPKYKIVRLAGTVLDKDKNKHRITLLTKYGVVNVKYNSGQFLYYDKEISQQNEDGSKTKLEKSWFTRGNKIMICGYRNDSQFRVYKYADSIYKHTTCLITEIGDDGMLMAATERVRAKNA